MGWNEPKKDPWGSQQKKEGPPDLDELARKVTRKLRHALAKHGKKVKPPKVERSRLVAVLIIAVIIIWIGVGFFVVSPQERAVTTLFGKYAKTVDPGVHWLPAGIASHVTLNTQKLQNFPYQADLFTKDGNIVSVTAVVQYQITHPYAYLFADLDSEATLQRAVASALHYVVGQYNLDDILTTARDTIREQFLTQLNKILNIYQIGLTINDISLQPIRPPEAVSAAFDDVNRAAEDQQRFIDEAKAYQQKVMPGADSQAKIMLEAAEAYKKKVVLNAQAETAQFLAILPQLERAPEIIKTRLYLETMQFIFQHSTKILISGNGNVVKLPLDQLLSEKAKTEADAKAVEAKSDAAAKDDKNSSDSGFAYGQARPTRTGYGGNTEAKQ